MTTPNEKGRNSSKSATQDTTTKVNSKDMSTSAQRKRVLEYLRAAAQTTYSLRKHGISHPAARIGELIDLGHRITSHPVTAIDSDGFMHRGVALYELKGELVLVDTTEAAHV